MTTIIPTYEEGFQRGVYEERERGNFQRNADVFDRDRSTVDALRTIARGIVFSLGNISAAHGEGARRAARELDTELDKLLVALANEVARQRKAYDETLNRS